MRTTTIRAALAAFAVTTSTLFSLAAYADGTAKRDMALVIMTDGLRADTVESGRMPNLERLRTGKWMPGYKSAWTFTGQVSPGSIPSSAPNHVSIATGYGVPTHGLTSNAQLEAGVFNAKPTWLKRIVDARPGATALFVFSWWPDANLYPAEGVEFMKSPTNEDDAPNASALSLRLAGANAPDATLWFIDAPDVAGHAKGFYPMTSQYLSAAETTDGYIGMALDAIASRPTFADEDWLVAVVSDHGGYANQHGNVQYGNQASHSVPIIICGTGMTQGRIPGVPHNFCVAANILAHFGVTVADLEATSADGVAEPPARALSDGLVAYLPFDDAVTANAVAGSAVAPEATGSPAIAANGVAGNCIDIPAGSYVKLSGSQSTVTSYGANSSFTATIWTRYNINDFSDDPVIFGNKHWGGTKTGVILAARVRKQVHPSNATYTYTGVGFNAGNGAASGTNRLDIHPFNAEGASSWTFYAVTRNEDGVFTIYQGRSDGLLGWTSGTLDGFTMASGCPFFIGTDGDECQTYTQTRPFIGAVDDFALWTRGLSHDDIRRIFKAGLRGQGIGRILESATYTGKGTDPTDFTDAANWECGSVPTAATHVIVAGETPFAVPVGAAMFQCASLTFDDAMLAGDADWRGLDWTKVAAGSAIDLNGRELLVSNADKMGEIGFCDTSAGNPGRLRLHVGSAFTNANVSLSGNLRLVKEGAGTFTATKSGQTYAGGTEIAEGVVQLGVDSSKNFGTGVMTIPADTVFELNGKNASDVSVVLAGGTLQNSASAEATLPKVLALTADSRVVHANAQSGSNDMVVPNQCQWNLGGKKLLISMTGNDSDFAFSASGPNVVSNGTISVAVGTASGVTKGFFAIRQINGKAGLRLALGTTYLRLQSGTGNSSVVDFTANPVGDVYNANNNRLQIYGMFTPKTATGFNMTMMGGSTLNLSQWTGAYNCAFPSNTYRTGSNKPCSLQFAANATVTVKLEGRSDLMAIAKSASPYIVTWSAKPAGTVSFVIDDATRSRGYEVVVEDGGLRLMALPGFSVILSKG